MPNLHIPLIFGQHGKFRECFLVRWIWPLWGLGVYGDMHVGLCVLPLWGMGVGNRWGGWFLACGRGVFG